MEAGLPEGRTWSGSKWAAARRAQSRRSPCSPGRRQTGLQRGSLLGREACRPATPSLPALARQPEAHLHAHPRALGARWFPVLGPASGATESCRKSPVFMKYARFFSPSLHLGQPSPPEALAQMSPVGGRLSQPPWPRWQTSCPSGPTPGPFGGTRHPLMDHIPCSRIYLFLCLQLSSKRQDPWLLFTEESLPLPGRLELPWPTGWVWGDHGEQSRDGGLAAPLIHDWAPPKV